MLFSIIIPVYNRAKTLPKCLDSVMSQDFDDFECILVNDGSSDNSLSTNTIQSPFAFSRPRFLAVPTPPLGLSKTMRRYCFLWTSI